jgi:hypothetical protein
MSPAQRHITRIYIILYSIDYYFRFRFPDSPIYRPRTITPLSQYHRFDTTTENVVQL